MNFLIHFIQIEYFNIDIHSAFFFQSGPSPSWELNTRKNKYKNKFCWRGKWNECKWFFFGHCALLYVLETASLFWGDPSCRIFSERLTCAGDRRQHKTNSIEHKKRHLSDECVNHKSVSTNFTLGPLSSRHCYRKDSFASHVYQNTHNKNNNTKVISDVFDSCSLRLNKQQRVWEWCLGTQPRFGFLGDWVRASTNFKSVPKATKYVDGFMMIIVSEKWLMPVCTLLSSSWLEITL